nr:MAG TPA: hypothetical protein [Caudoviricetes sp.]
MKTVRKCPSSAKTEEGHSTFAQDRDHFADAAMSSHDGS